MSLFAELKRRNVFRVALFYVVAAWVVVQVAETVLPLFVVPDGVLRGLVIVLALGFVPALVFAWVYEFTPEGIKRDAEVEVSEQTRQRSAHKLNWATLVVAVLAIGLLLADRLLQQPVATRMPPESTAPAVVEADQSINRVHDNSIAVLPFADLSPERDQEYFSDGLAEEILNLLASVRDLSVASRTSAFSFKGSGLPIPEIAGRLGVNYILEGSVRKADDRIRVTVQLIDARSDRHLWSKNYDRTLADVFAVQDEIAGAIGQALQVALLGRDGETVATTEIAPDLYEKFLQARFLLRQRNDAAIASGIEQLEAVVEAAPGFARALALLAEAYLLVRTPELDPRAEPMLGRALAIDPNLGSAIMVRGNIAELRGDPLAAYTDYRRAIELAPEEPRPHHWLTIVYTSMGYPERAEQAIARAAELEPGNANIRGWQSVLLARRGAREEAVSAALQQARLGNPIGHLQAALYLLDNDIERAAEQLRMADLAGDAYAPGLAPLIRIARGETDRIEPFIQALRDRDVDWYLGIAGLLALDLDEALLQALDELDDDYGVNVHALFWTDANAPLRADPRFIRFMERQGAFPLWRTIGPPPDCVEDGDSFRCGLSGKETD